MADNTRTIKIGKSSIDLQFNMVPTANLGLPSKAGRDAAERAKRKHVVINNSHSLSDFQRCEKRYEFNNLIQIEPSERKQVFAVGAYWGKMLEIYYRAISKKTSPPQLSKLIRRMSKCAANNPQFDDKEQNLLSTRIIEYRKKYVNENPEVLCVETGFSVVLYEDEKHLFIYEGRPDRIIKINDPLNHGQRVLCIVDDKTRATNKDLVNYNNQIFGYLFGTKANYFVYNYMGKQLDTKLAFGQQPVRYSDEEIERWRQLTIKWYFRMLNARLNDDFLESLQCPGQYSNCEFLSLCSSKDSIEYNAVLNSKFKKRDGERRSW